MRALCGDRESKTSPLILQYFKNSSLAFVPFSASVRIFEVFESGRTEMFKCGYLVAMHPMLSFLWSEESILSYWTLAKYPHFDFLDTSLRSVWQGEGSLWQAVLSLRADLPAWQSTTPSLRDSAVAESWQSIWSFGLLRLFKASQWQMRFPLSCGWD